LQDKTERDSFLEYSIASGVMTRPIWRLLNTLPMYKNCQTTDLENANYLADRIVNLPSSVRL
jgi:perosamine synthetase